MSTLRITLLSVGIFLIFFPSAVSAKVTINEVSSFTSADWIELFNTPDATTAANLEGIRIRDTSATNKKDLSGTLLPGEYKIVEFNNWLNKDGDSIRLVNVVGTTEVDMESLSYGTKGGLCVPGENESIGRFPDGTGVFVRFSSETKGVSNTSTQSLCPTASPSPTVQPTSTPEPSTQPQNLSPTPFVKQTSKPQVYEEEKPTAPPRVLSSQTTSPTPTLEASSLPEFKASTKRKMPIVAIVFISLGIICVIGALSPLWIKRLRRYNNKVHENE